MLLLLENEKCVAHPRFPTNAVSAFFCFRIDWINIFLPIIYIYFFIT